MKKERLDLEKSNLELDEECSLTQGEMLKKREVKEVVTLEDSEAMLPAIQSNNLPKIMNQEDNRVASAVAEAPEQEVELAKVVVEVNPQAVQEVVSQTVVLLDQALMLKNELKI